MPTAGFLRQALIFATPFSSAGFAFAIIFISFAGAAGCFRFRHYAISPAAADAISLHSFTLLMPLFSPPFQRRRVFAITVFISICRFSFDAFFDFQRRRHTLSLFRWLLMLFSITPLPRERRFTMPFSLMPPIRCR
jgi:hypothetical protein